MSSDQIRILDGNTFVVSDERGDIEASLDRPDRAVLVRHALPVEVGADRQRGAADGAVGRRPPVLRDALLPRAGHRHGLRRLEAVGDPAPHRGQRLPRGADDPQPRRTSRSSSTFGSRPTATSPICSRSRTRLPKKGTYLEAGRHARAACSAYERETFMRATVISSHEPCAYDENGPDVRDHDRPARDVDDHARRSDRSELRTADDAGDDGHGARVASPTTATGTWRTTWRAGSKYAPRLECDWEPLKTTYRRSLVDLAALRFSPLSRRTPHPAGRGLAVVHDDVRARQHLHQPAGAAVHARAGGDDAARARLAAGHAHRRLPRRGARAGSCTRCATAR